MSDPLSGLLATLDLTDTGARTREDIFTGPSQWMPGGRVFGGQVLAQSIVAAMRTVRADRVIHSAHGYFLRPGDVELPITFSVDRIHDGRSFSTRRTQAYQDGRADPVDDRVVPGRRTTDSSTRSRCPPTFPIRSACQHRRSARGRRPPGRAVLGHPTRVRHPARRVPALLPRRRRQRAAAGGLDEGDRHPARRPEPAPRGARLRERLLDPRARAARPRHPVVDTRGSRSRVSTTRCGGTASPGSTSGCSTCRSRRTRSADVGSRSGRIFTPRRRARRECRPGGHGAGSGLRPMATHARSAC